MILFGCLLAFGMAVAPRLVLILAWLFSDRWAKVWEGEFLLPLLGIIFLPFTTIMYMLTVVVLPGGGVLPLDGWDWLWIILGLLLDLAKWGQVLTNRRAGTEYATHYYPAGAPGSATIRSDSAAMSAAEVSTGTVPASTSPTTDAPASGTPTPETAPADDEGGSSGSGSS